MGRRRSEIHFLQVHGVTSFTFIEQETEFFKLM